MSEKRHPCVIGSENHALVKKKNGFSTTSLNQKDSSWVKKQTDSPVKKKFPT